MFLLLHDILLTAGDNKRARVLLARAREAISLQKKSSPGSNLACKLFFLTSSANAPTLFERSLDGTLIDLLSKFS